MALAGELAKYIGNEIVKVGGKDLATKTATSALSSLAPKVATKAGTSLLNQATALGLAKNDANKWVLNTGILDTDEGVGKIKDFMNPILGGDKTPNYQRFLEQIGEGEYQMGHRPNLYVGDSETKFPLSNMEADPDYLPKIYGDNEASTVRNLLMLGNTGPDAQRSAKIIAQYQNQPDKMVKIFRQAPKDMNYGDWVGLTKEYADNHIGNNPNNQLWEREVPASEVMFAGDDINEWGYYPKEVQLDDEIANELNRAIEMSGSDMSVAKRADSYLGGRMLDKTGKPITFYHSTPNEFSKFDDARLGENTGYDNTALGHFVTTDKDFSKRFIDIDNTGKTGRTMELQAKIQKPITHPYMAGQKYDEKELDKIVEDYLIATNNQDGLENLRELAEEDGTSLYDAYMDLTFGGDSPFEYSADDRKALLNNGYDAVEIVEGPKSGLVEGSKDNTPVSSYAVFNGENLRPIRHLPISSVEGEGLDIPVSGSVLNKVAKYLKSPTDANADGVINWNDVKAVYNQAKQQQAELDKMGRAIAEKEGFPEYTDFLPKSIESMENKVKRKGGDYSLASMKDHTRNKIVMNSWNDVPKVINDLTEILGGEPTVEFVMNDWGYKGLHITGRFDNGLGWELQLSTPEDWPRKLRSDAIYDKWRNVQLDNASPKEIMGYMNAMRESKAMWSESKIPDLSMFDNTRG